MRTAIRNLKSLFLTAFFLYILIGFTLFLMQDAIIFYPDQIPFEECTSFPEGTETVEYEGERFFYKNNSEELVIFYHGNAASGCSWGFLGDIFNAANKSYIVTIFPGYSGDIRNPSMDGIKEYANTVNDFVSGRYSEDNIILMGFSLGSSVAAYHAGLDQYQKLLFLSALPSIGEIASQSYPIYPVKLMLKDDLDVGVLLDDFEGEILLVHPRDDDIVPHETAKEFFENLNTENKSFYTIEGGHNHLFNSKKTFEIIDNFLKN